MTTTKKSISDEFARLRKYGFKVFNFNGNKQIKFGSFTDFVDTLVINDRVICFIEVKIGKDKLSDGQEELQRLLASHDLKTRGIMSRIVKNINQAAKLVDELLEYRG